MIKWISVKDRLPDNNRDVLILRTNYPYGTEKEIRDSWYSIKNMDWACTFDRITHWAEINYPEEME